MEVGFRHRDIVDGDEDIALLTTDEPERRGGVAWEEVHDAVALGGEPGHPLDAEYFVYAGSTHHGADSSRDLGRSLVAGWEPAAVDDSDRDQHDDESEDNENRMDSIAHGLGLLLPVGTAKRPDRLQCSLAKASHY